MVGLIEDPAHVTTQFFKSPGDVILLVGDLGGTDDLGGSHLLKVVHGRKAGRPPRLDYARERAVQGAVLALIRAGLVRSAHDCSEGGLAVALAEGCISGEQRFGATVELAGVGAGDHPGIGLRRPGGAAGGRRAFAAIGRGRHARRGIGGGTF